jgi:predicted DNA-binding transcriptional regulator AlpA
MLNRARLTSAQVRLRFGGISDMTLWRWLKDENLNFPRPLTINRRRYWTVEDVEKWERYQAAKCGA